MGEVPVLFDTEAQYQISQSGAILDYIADLSGQLGTTARDQREILRWILWDNHKLSSQAGTVRFLTNFLPEEKRPLEAISYMKNRLKSAYKVLNAHLENRDWMVGSALSNADISCCGYLFYPEPLAFSAPIAPYRAWLTRIETTPGWQHPYDLMPAPTVGTNIRSPNDRRFYLRRRTHTTRQRPQRRRFDEVTSARLSAVVLNALADRNGFRAMRSKT